MSIGPILRSNFHRFVSICLQACISLSLIGCSLTGKQSTLDPKGPLAQNQLEIFMVTVYVSLFIFVIVASTLIWVIIRFREKPGDEALPLPKSEHGNPLIEVGLIAASISLLQNNPLPWMGDL